jgi:hypothetical protein
MYIYMYIYIYICIVRRLKVNSRNVVKPSRLDVAVCPRNFRTIYNFFAANIQDLIIVTLCGVYGNNNKRSGVQNSIFSTRSTQGMACICVNSRRIVSDAWLWCDRLHQEEQRKCLADNASYIAILLTQACDAVTLRCCNKRWEIRTIQFKCRSNKIGMCPPTAAGWPVSNQHVISSSKASDFYLTGHGSNLISDDNYSVCCFPWFPTASPGKLGNDPFLPRVYNSSFIITKKIFDWTLVRRK